MSKKRSPLWNYFEEEVADHTNVICKVGDCKQIISRGKTGKERSRLSNSGMRGHLKSCHTNEYEELLAKENEIGAANAATEEEDTEAENSTKEQEVKAKEMTKT